MLQAINKRSASAFTEVRRYQKLACCCVRSGRRSAPLTTAPPRPAQEDERLVVEVASLLSALLPGLMQYETQQDTLREEIEAARTEHRINARQ